jgi:hypothetical protein
MPNSLLLPYQGEAGNDAKLIIDLDVFEMLQRPNQDSGRASKRTKATI